MNFLLISQNPSFRTTVSVSEAERLLRRSNLTFAHLIDYLYQTSPSFRDHYRRSRWVLHVEKDDRLVQVALNASVNTFSDNQTFYLRPSPAAPPRQATSAPARSQEAVDRRPVRPLRWIALLLLVGGIIILNIPNQSDQPEAQVCTFSVDNTRSVDNIRVSATDGIVYSVGLGDGLKVRGSIDKLKATIHFIVNKQMLYVWNTSHNQGAKFPFKPKSVNQIFILDLVKEFKCKDWALDNSVFEVPKNINFSEHSKTVVLDWIFI